MRYFRLSFYILHFAFCIFNCAAQDQSDSTNKKVPPSPKISEEPTFRLFLIGDAGEGDTTGATLHDLRTRLLDAPNSAVVFLGDNCYNTTIFNSFEINGFDGSKRAIRRVMSQLNILRDYKGYAYFIPGNHDWWNLIDIKKGMERLGDEQKFIEDTLRTFTSLKNHDTGTFLPSNGSPGPVSKNFNEGRTRIIFLDTYRLILEEAREKNCDTLCLPTFYDDLQNELNDATKKKQKIIVVAHHPVFARGKHSFPLKLYERVFRRFRSSNLNYPPYNKMAMHLDSLLKMHNRPDIYYVAGHEHSLEYFFNDSLHYLVSGAGSKVSQVDYKEVQNEQEYLIWNEKGYFEIAFFGKYERVIMYHRKTDAEEMKVLCLTGCK